MVTSTPLAPPPANAPGRRPAFLVRPDRLPARTPRAANSAASRTKAQDGEPHQAGAPKVTHIGITDVDDDLPLTLPLPPGARRSRSTRGSGSSQISIHDLPQLLPIIDVRFRPSDEGNEVDHEAPNGSMASTTGRCQATNRLQPGHVPHRGAAPGRRAPQADCDADPGPPTVRRKPATAAGQCGPLHPERSRACRAGRRTGQIASR